MSLKSTWNQLTGWLGQTIDSYTGKGAIDSQNKYNQDQQKFMNQMYDKQRKDSLIDFDMQNEYNSPKNVMERYRKAGLNPNLIYDNGTTASAATIKSSDAKGFSGAAPAGSAGNVIPLITGAGKWMGDFVDNQLKKSQIQNLNQQTENAKSTNSNLLLESVNKQIKNETDKTNLSILQKTKDDLIRKIQYEGYNENVKHNLGMQQVNQNEILNPLKMKMSEKQIQMLDEQLKNKEFQNAFLEYEAELRETLGLSPTSAAYINMMLKFIGNGAMKLPRGTSQKFKGNSNRMLHGKQW